MGSSSMERTTRICPCFIFLIKKVESPCDSAEGQDQRLESCLFVLFIAARSPTLGSEYLSKSPIYILCMHTAVISHGKP